MKRPLGLLVSLSAVLLTGCATLFGPRSRALQVTSEPSGARVFVAGADSGVTPLTLRLHRARRPVALRLEKTGYQVVTDTVKRDRLSSLLWLDALAGLWGAASAAFGGSSVAAGFAGGLIWTAGIDFMTGAALRPSVRELRVTLPAAATAGRSP
ncbi:MAG: PEGA domain-containing protein [Gemmatimonadaceae bacterium]|jgi:hypothetical protein